MINYLKAFVLSFFVFYFISSFANTLCCVPQKGTTDYNNCSGSGSNNQQIPTGYYPACGNEPGQNPCCTGAAGENVCACTGICYKNNTANSISSQCAAGSSGSSCSEFNLNGACCYPNGALCDGYCCSDG